MTGWDYFSACFGLVMMLHVLIHHPMDCPEPRTKIQKHGSHMAHPPAHQAAGFSQCIAGPIIEHTQRVK
jgi:hypothetical protein